MSESILQPFSPSPPGAYDKALMLAHEVSDLFSADDWTLDWPRPEHIRFRGQFTCDLAADFGQLRERFERHGYTPMVRQSKSGVILIAAPFTFAKNKPNYLLALLLFLFTIASTLYVGALYQSGFAFQLSFEQIWRGWPFSLSMLLILTAHELGHFFAARYHKVQVSPPYFIPFPTLLGTMGAFISMKEPAPNKRVLLDIGAAGPLFGLVFAIPILFIGLLTSEVGPISAAQLAAVEGNSMFYALAKTLVFGRFLPSAGQDVYLNQVAWAGWAGLLVTSLNLMPVGQLDGGHITYVLLGERARKLLWPFLILLTGLAAYDTFYLERGGVWWLWIFLLFFFGRVHAQPLDDVTPLDPRRRFIALLTLAIAIFIFIPSPL